MGGKKVLSIDVNQLALWKIINLHTVNPKRAKQIKELHGTKGKEK